MPELAAVLTEAFATRKPFTWLVPDDELRPSAQLAMFNGALRHVYPVERGAEIGLDSGAIVGGAVWAPPGAWKAPAWRQLRVLPGLIRAIGIRLFREYGERARAVEAPLHRAHPSEPHWYLAMLGTAPDAQGKGVASALVRSGIERCDRHGHDAYLECFERLVPFYERFGFERMREIEMPDDIPHQVGMWRSAADAAAIPVDALAAERAA